MAENVTCHNKRNTLSKVHLNNLSTKIFCLTSRIPWDAFLCLKNIIQILHNFYVF